MSLCEGESDAAERTRLNGYESVTPAEVINTPPTYIVRETSDGKFVNDSFGVEWPERPKFGRHSMKEHAMAFGSVGYRSPTTKKHRHRHHKRNQSESSDDESERNVNEKEVRGERSQRRHRRNTRRMGEIAESSCRQPARGSGAVPPLQERSSNQEGQDEVEESNERFFVGAMTSQAVADQLRPNDFRIYYPTPFSAAGLVPVNVSLYLAYRSTLGEVFHFPIVCTRDGKTSKEEWRVQYGDPQSASFNSLSALIRYHKIYSYMDPKTGVIDTFPVWRGRVIDVNDSDFD